MALIEIYHVVADMYPVDPEVLVASEIIEGTLMTLSSGGFAEVCSNKTRCIGIAGDTQSNMGTNAVGPNTPYAASLIINGAGATRVTENRVSDFFNETLASGKITIYHSGGTFATDLFESTVDSADPPAALYSSENGYLTTASGNGQVVGTVTAAVQAWDSGVPGVNTSNGSMSLGDYVTFKLEV
jgi:hypothetical protein